MKRIPYIAGAFIFGFGGLAANGDRSGHTITIVVRQVDKMYVTHREYFEQEPASVQKEAGNINRITWSSTKLGKKITVRIGYENGSMRQAMHVVTCSGGSADVLPQQPGGCLDLVSDTKRSGECIVSISPVSADGECSVNDVMYTFMDTY